MDKLSEKPPEDSEKREIWSLAGVLSRMRNISFDVSDVFTITPCSCDWLIAVVSQSDQSVPVNRRQLGHENVWRRRDTCHYRGIKREFWDKIQPGDDGITCRAEEVFAHVPLWSLCTLASFPVLPLEEVASWPLRGFCCVNKAVRVRDEWIRALWSICLINRISGVLLPSFQCCLVCVCVAVHKHVGEPWEKSSCT